MFVLSLRKKMYLYQFGQFAWTHTIIMVVIVPSSFIVANLFEGILWWVLPASLVVANDICAYLAGALRACVTVCVRVCVCVCACVCVRACV